jgi:quercetin dioxygenase-like cupin family protein
VTTNTTTGRTLLEVAGSRVIEHIGGAETNGAVALLEFQAAPGYPVPTPHVHERDDELTYVLEGELEVQLGDEIRLVGAGESVLKPHGIPHAFRVRGQNGARFLELVTPAGFEGYFRAAAAALHRGAAPTPELATSLMASFGVTPA